MNKKELEKLIKKDVEKQESKKFNFFDKVNEMKEKFKEENKLKKEMEVKAETEEVVEEKPVKEVSKEQTTENVVILQEPTERTEERFNKERSTRKTKSIKKETK